MTTELTLTQEAFLKDLKAHKVLCISMVQIQKKYSDIASKASIKRDIESLVVDGLIIRTHRKLMVRGKITSSTMYQYVTR